jgi:hypothetical protein
MNMVSTTVLSQSAANTAAFAQTASAMFAMDEGAGAKMA